MAEVLGQRAAKPNPAPSERLTGCNGQNATTSLASSCTERGNTSCMRELHVRVFPPSNFSFWALRSRVLVALERKRWQARPEGSRGRRRR